MASSLLASEVSAWSAVVGSGRLPSRWAEQQPLLERQHARLEALISTLIEQHAATGPLSEVAEVADELACRRLLWTLRLHLRLEERWLGQWGVLCPGHLANHRAVAQAALADFRRCRRDRAGRLAVLRGLHGWFLQHQAGPDAMAYGLAAQAAATA